ncbi:Holliday junction resolvase RecU [Mycoplasma iguanae]|uniref:Holliday junction resolvase RecU n=1 Tax=Mycoplasma iguanae TaxID=292461 RepID=A0ABY5R9Q5_9MOLU|nr:Holliday junction resolvase RecU [Mycoplasma iguanae]UVD81519.1 Holliday junction resolvase RecU [Mycoplasma iguanae]
MQKNRGMLLEKIINTTIDFYLKNGIAIFHKKNLDIVFGKVIKEDKAKKLEQTYLAKKSTVDYYGIYQGQFIAFEAKSVEGNILPLYNIKEHQIKYLEKINAHGGKAFLIILFKEKNAFFMLKPEYLRHSSKKSINYEQIQKEGISLQLNYPGILDFVPLLNLI